MIVCICGNVSESTIREMAPHMSLEDFKKTTGACQQCHKCCDTLEKIYKEVRSAGALRL